MSGFSVPNAVNYASPLNAVPLDWTSSPVEGPKGIQCSIAWGTDGGPNNAVYLNCQNNATLNFSKVRALIIDNSACGSDVQFIFPDTETTVSVPAYTPYAIIPVFTNQVQFYIVCPNAEAEDVTNFTVLNTAPPPVAVPTTQEQNFFTSSGINVDTTGSQQVVPTSVSGTLEAMSITGFIYGSASGGSVTLSLIDGTSKNLWEATFAVVNNGFSNFSLAQLTDLHLRFEDGLSFVWTTLDAPNSTFIAPNLYYRTP